MNSAEAEDLAQAYFERRGCVVDRVPTCDHRTPDFRVMTERGFAFYAEVMLLEPLYETTGVDWDQLHRKLEGRFRKALEQFDAVNSARLVPNVVVFVAPGLVNVNTPEDLLFMVTGTMLGDDGSVLARRVEYARRKLAERFRELDACLLIAPNGRDGPLIVSDVPEFRTRLADVLTRVPA